MDKARAHQWFGEILGKSVGGWTIEEFLGFGKSAIVVKSRSATGEVGALKLFEPELVARYGIEVQLKRIERELQLVGYSHPHLISILDGGQDGEFLYIVMECLPSPWVPLSDVLEKVPRDRIGSIVASLAEAASALELKKLVHRDIKPENVMVLGPSFDQVKLMDFGVIRPIGQPGITDMGANSKPFIGTLRYTPPEYLVRQELDDEAAWRAVTFYQLGGVLHDLIMKKPLFHDFSEPFVRLADAVREQTPTVDATDVRFDLVALCKNCLIKDWKVRLSCVSWTNFSSAMGDLPDHAESARDRVRNRPFLVSSQAPPPSAEHQRRMATVAMTLAVDTVKLAIRAVVEGVEFPPFSISASESQDPSVTKCKLRFYIEPRALARTT